MTTKLKIDLSEGKLEVEGSEAFVRAIYEDFKINFIPNTQPTETAKQNSTRRRTKKAAPEKQAAEPTTVQPTEAVEDAPAKPPKRRKTTPAPSYNLVPDLPLSQTDDHPSLIEFTDAKVPITNDERNLVFSYFLYYLGGQDQVTVNHIYTCYYEIKMRVPVDLEASLASTANRNWIDLRSNGRIVVTSMGKRYVENELPVKR